MKEKRSKFSKSGIVMFFYYLFDFVWFYIKAPYYIIKGLVFILNKSKEASRKISVESKRKSLEAKYWPFRVLQTDNGSFDKWENKVMKSESSIGIIVGARGSGKTAFGIKLLENIYAKKKKRCFAMGFPQEEMPSWIQVIDNVKNIVNDSYLLIDEGGILFSSRRAMTNVNKLMSDLLLIARHKNLSIIFISQNSSNLDVNIIRQADYLVLKKSSLLQRDFERKRIQDIYNSLDKKFAKYDSKKTSYIYSEEFTGFAENELPSFWSAKISKSFAKR